jgi:hypothetical protein
MATTQYRGYPVPEEDGSDQPDGAAQIRAFGAAVDADVQVLSTGYRLAAVLNYTSSGTFQKGNYAGCRAVEVEVIGGGGGSGYAAATSGSQISWGLGGAGGGYAKGFIDASALSASETVTVGAGGTGGTSGTPDGGNGGDSAFGSHLTGSGGGGGDDSGATATSSSGVFYLRDSGGVGGGTAAQISVPGEGSGSVEYTNPNLTSIVGLRGGASGGPYGVTQYEDIGEGPISGSQNASAGVGIGGGARGGLRIQSSSAQNGAAGAAGRVIVRVYV